MKTLLLAFLAIVSCNLLAQNSVKGVLKGSNEALPGAIVKIENTNIGVASETDGSFILLNIPAGKQKLIITYLGFETLVKEIEITATQNLNLGELEMKESARNLNEVEVKSTFKRGSENKAINMTKTSQQIVTVIASESIKKLPDKNAAETLKRVAGAAVQNNKGEGSFISLRGTPIDWTATLINGHRMPVADEDNTSRSFEFEVLPSELIDFVVVTRTVTPDIEADNIGGAINFLLKGAPDKRTFSISASGGYNSLAQKPIMTANLLYGDRSKNGKFGFVVNGSYYGRYYAAHVYKLIYGYQTNQGINRLQLKDYDGMRNTIGANAALEYKPKDGIKLTGRFLYGTMLDDKWQRLTSYNYTDGSGGRIRLQNIHGKLQRQLFGGELVGEFKVSPRFKIEAKLATFYNSFKYGNVPYKNKDPRNGYLAVEFESPLLEFKDVAYTDFFGNALSIDSPGGIITKLIGNDDPYGNGDKYTNIQPKPYITQYNPNNPLVLDTLPILAKDMFFSYAYTEINQTRESDPVVAQVDATYDIRNNVKLKLGSKFRWKEGERKIGKYEWFAKKGNGFPSTPRSLDDFETAPLNERGGFLKELGSPYAGKFYPFFTRNQLNNFIGNMGDSLYEVPMDTTNPEYYLWQGTTYNYTEYQIAGYAMAEVKLGKVTLVGGVRLEHTMLDETSDTSRGDLASTDVVRNGQSSTVFFSHADKRYTRRNYLAILPSLNVTYAINDKMNLRGAVSRTFHRPNFEETKPGAPIIRYTELDFTFGNPNLKPSYSLNFDVVYEYYWDNKGMFSIGGYYKYVTNHIFATSTNERDAATNIIYKRYDNAKLSHVGGIEAMITRKFDFLPKWLSGFGVSANITYSLSQMSVPGRNKSQAMTEQTPLLYNVALFYEKYGVNARIALNYNGAYLKELNLAAGLRNDGTFGLYHQGTDFDVFKGQNYSLDAQIGYEFKKHFSVYLELSNLLDYPDLTYRGEKSRPLRTEYYRQKAQIGFKYDL